MSLGVIKKLAHVEAFKKTTFLSVLMVDYINLNRYSPRLMEKILQMAEGIDIGEMPSYDLMLSKPSKGHKRHLSTYDGEYTCFWKMGFEETTWSFYFLTI